MVFNQIFPRDDNLWVFGSWYGEKFSDNSRALFDYCVTKKNKNLLKFVWLTRNNDGIWKIKIHMIIFIKYGA